MDGQYPDLQALARGSACPGSVALFPGAYEVPGWAQALSVHLRAAEVGDHPEFPVRTTQVWLRLGGPGASMSPASYRGGEDRTKMTSTRHIDKFTSSCENTKTSSALPLP